jgi:hypothetical protein
MCLDGFIPNDDGDCVATMQPTSTPSTVPSALPSVFDFGFEELAAAETEKPTASPTAQPSWDPTIAPTAPTPIPTLLPTQEACADGNHNCDTLTSVCQHQTNGDFFVSAQASVYCMCLDGFVNNGDLCVATLAPTATPSVPPTLAPTHLIGIDLSVHIVNEETDVVATFASQHGIPADGAIEIDVPPQFQDVDHIVSTTAVGIDGTFITKTGHKIEGQITLMGMSKFGGSEIAAFNAALNVR